ncbi:TetR-like C-terminal domain-containing protein [Streptomyces sp. NPDC087263]|uniref:TetR-like C-terminal domain-containing protein n=1 Tax=Streptomyces sp. NPDC087263 TaxID=3365773 RepID=UPI003828BCB7
MLDVTDEPSTRRSRVSRAREMELPNAAPDVLGEVSYEELSMDLIAAQGRCSKATLDKLWPTKPQLVGAALHATRPMRPEEVDTGTLHGDLLTMVGLLVAGGETMTAPAAAVGHGVLTDEELARAVRTSVVEPWFADPIGSVERAVERREPATRPPGAHFLPEVLLSLALTRPLFGRGPADTDHLTRCVDQLLLPLLEPTALQP